MCSSDLKDSILKDNTYGLAPKLLVNTLNGFSEKETLSLNFLENECLNLKIGRASCRERV